MSRQGWSSSPVCVQNGVTHTEVTVTEHEWLTSTNLSAMLIHLRGEVEPAEADPDPRTRSITGHGDLVEGPARRTTSTRLAQFARECCREWWELPLDEPSRELLTHYERCLDGREAWENFQTACCERWNTGASPSASFVSAFRAMQWSPTPFGVSSLTQTLAWVTASHVHRETIAELERTATEDERFAWGFFGYDFPGFQETANTIFDPLPSLLRDVIGNPFRPLRLDPAWRTSTAVALADSMYSARNFTVAPILADALEDAGCDDPAILEHLRGENVHVRGCHVVDAVLGRE